jgi:hypothetical protein
MADIGSIRRRISFYDLSPVKDSEGSWTSTETLVLTCWAFRKILNRGRDYIQKADSFVNAFEYEIYFNSSLNIDTNLIIRDGEDYNITGWELVGDRKRKYIIRASARHD